MNQEALINQNVYDRKIKWYRMEKGMRHFSPFTMTFWPISDRKYETIIYKPKSWNEKSVVYVLTYGTSTFWIIPKILIYQILTVVFILSLGPDEQFIAKVNALKLSFKKQFCSWECPGWFKHFQEFLLKIVGTKIFELFIVLCIVTNTIFLAMDSHDADEDLKYMLSIGNSVFTYIFAAEAFLKILGYGFITYLKDPWNTFDFIIVVISLSDVFVSLNADSSQQSGLNVLRTLRNWLFIYHPHVFGNFPYKKF